MSDLHKALGDISSIRRQMAQSTEFRGYGPATLAATGAIAVLAGVSGYLDRYSDPVSGFNRGADSHAHASHAFRHGR
jgi:hypothetical protein